MTKDLVVGLSTQGWGYFDGEYNLVILCFDVNFYLILGFCASDYPRNSEVDYKYFKFNFVNHHFITDSQICSGMYKLLIITRLVYEFF